MTFMQAVRACLRRWWLILAIVVVAVGATLALSPASRRALPQYTAKAILLPNLAPANSQTSVNLPQAALETTVGAVPPLAAAALHYAGNPAALAAEVNATTDETVGTLSIAVSGPNGTRDAAVANAFATALNQYVTGTAVAGYQKQVAAVESRLNALQGQINQYQGRPDPVSQAKLGAAEDQYRLAYDQFQQLAAQGQPGAAFNVLQKAVPALTGGTNPPRSRLYRGLVAGLVGLLVGIALAIGLDLLWPRINDRIDAEREFGTPVLAEVPKLTRAELRDHGIHHLSRPRLASFREAYRMLRTSILLMGSADGQSGDGVAGTAEQLLVSGPQVILITSALPGAGKSTTVANLAVAMAESGRRVLICNADFRAPQVHLAFGLEPGPGLTDLLTGAEGSQHLADMVHPTNVPGVSLVHSGTTIDNAAELVATRGARLLEEARSMADVVLLDTAPLLVVSDASELLSAVDAVIMVARAGQTSRDAAHRSAELLDRAGIPVLGVVLVGAQSPISYYYRGLYGYYPRLGRRGWCRWLPRRRRTVMQVVGKSRRGAVASNGAPARTNGPVKEPSATRGPD
jgi:capsular exopolysaccharide synthesis family protein